MSYYKCSNMRRGKELNKKKWYKKLGFYFLMSVLILSIVVIPIVINEIYKYGATISNPYITMWGAEDVLSYCGTVLSFLGTFILGLVAYKQNERANTINDQLAELTKQANSLTEQANNLNKELNDKNIKANVRPALVINRVRTGYTGDWLGAMVAKMQEDMENLPSDAIRTVENIKYYEDEIDGFYFTIKDNFLGFTSKLSSEQLKSIENKIHCEKTNNAYSMVAENNLYAPYRLISVGVGPAVNVSVRLYEEGEQGKNNVDVASLPLSLKTNIDYRLGFYIENATDMIGKYILEITFYDILNNKFVQMYNISIDKSGFKLETYMAQKEL